MKSNLQTLFSALLILAVYYTATVFPLFGQFTSCTGVVPNFTINLTSSPSASQSTAIVIPGGGLGECCGAHHNTNWVQSSSVKRRRQQNDTLIIRYGCNFLKTTPVIRYINVINLKLSKLNLLIADPFFFSNIWLKIACSLTKPYRLCELKP